MERNRELLEQIDGSPAGERRLPNGGKGPTESLRKIGQDRQRNTSSQIEGTE